jgi:hypothetical protein
MRALLMYPDRDFDLQQKLPGHAQAVTQDLELETVLRAMSGEDEFLLKVARQALLTSLQNDVDTVLYRQAILTDSLKAPAVVRQLYALAVETTEAKRKHYFGVFARSPGGILYESIELLKVLLGMLRRLRAIADTSSAGFESPGYTNFFMMLQTELTDEYLASIETHLRELRFRDGMLVSVDLGHGNEGTNYVLRRPQGKGPNWFDRLLGRGPPGHTFHIADRDEAGHRAVSDLRDRSINAVANALAQSADHVGTFFDLLRAELAFYVGSLNLHEKLASIGAPMSLPRPEATGARAYRFSGLYDVSLALRTNRTPVSNAIDADGKTLVIVTGANQGGKSTFLRATGLAQLMMQCGMFVGADGFTAELCSDLFTHYKREEDATMTSGKFEEELRRMSEIADEIRPNSIVLFNESFASTNEREGSEIARQIVCALLERGIKVLFVTHLYDFARGFFDKGMDAAVFLRAERRPDGKRTFKLVEGEPLETSYGEDVYREVFAREVTTPGRTATAPGASTP